PRARGVTTRWRSWRATCKRSATRSPSGSAGRPRTSCRFNSSRARRTSVSRTSGWRGRRSGFEGGRRMSALLTSNTAVYTGTFDRRIGARVMLRGLRSASDMESEFTMSLMNLNLDPEIETVFLMAKEPYSHLSSTLLRQIATFGGKLDHFLPPNVAEALGRRV